MTLLEPTLATLAKNPPQIEFLKLLFAGNPWNCECETLKTVQVRSNSTKFLIREIVRQQSGSVNPISEPSTCFVTSSVSLASHLQIFQE